MVETLYKTYRYNHTKQQYDVYMKPFMYTSNVTATRASYLRNA